MFNLKSFQLVWHSSIIEEMPNQIEQDISEAYVCYREINRPKLTIGKVIISFVFVLCLILITTYITIHSFETLNLNLILPTKLLSFKLKYPSLFFCLIYFSLLTIITIIYLKEILIIPIILYQRYADEDIRRRCLFKPTCSEYTILALRKYGVIIGLYKAYVRIFKKCIGNIYRIDFP